MPPFSSTKVLTGNPCEIISHSKIYHDQSSASVPISGSPNVLGQAERRAGHDGAGRLEDEELERKRTPMDRLLP